MGLTAPVGFCSVSFLPTPITTLREDASACASQGVQGNSTLARSLNHESREKVVRSEELGMMWGHTVPGLSASHRLSGQPVSYGSGPHISFP